MKAKLWGAWTTEPVILRAIVEFVGVSETQARLILMQGIAGKQAALNLLDQCGIELIEK